MSILLRYMLRRKIPPPPGSMLIFWQQIQAGGVAYCLEQHWVGGGQGSKWEEKGNSLRSIKNIKSAIADWLADHSLRFRR